MTENWETFFSRLEPHFSPRELLDIKLAYMMAKYGHRSQVRKETDEEGNPLRYFEHLRRTAINVIDVAQVLEKDVIIAALLHDSLEDTRDLTPDLIEHCFGESVVKMVKSLSKVPKEGYLGRLRNVSDWRVLLVKACDRLDNLQSLVKTGRREFIDRQLLETERDYFQVFWEMVQMAPVGKSKQHAHRMYEAVVGEVRYIRGQLAASAFATQQT